jgi:Na+-transporting NADH:ubiquinone oxidoreductase subunit NqrC
MNNMSDKTLRILVVIFALLSLYTTFMLSNASVDLKKQKVEIEQLNKDVDSLTILSDSLSVELFPSQVELTRYQIAFELFVKRNPKAASQYGDIISQETE